MKKYLLISGISIGMIILTTWLTYFSGSQQINSAIYASFNSIKAAKHPNNITPQEKTEPLVFIYHTHNRESFVPELQITSPEEAQSIDINKNITSVGKHLSEKLEGLKIKALVDRTDYGSETNFSYADSYKLSRVTVVNALKINPSLKMVFDIHRNSLPREKTTISINGSNVAKVQFVVTRSNTKYQDNIKFTNTLHDKIQTNYPGLPQVLIKDASPETSLSYNQDLLQNSLVIEIGGPENSLEEEYRAVDILAQTIAELAPNLH
ncbi:stage II sporulation protein P [Paenibacillus sp. 1_12]|nr:stage II sporulation protein P [Paenibacillus sp. 1_12]